MKVNEITTERLAAALKQLRIETLPGKEMALGNFLRRYQLPYSAEIGKLLVDDHFMRYEYVSSGNLRTYYWLVGETDKRTAAALFAKCYEKMKYRKNEPQITNIKVYHAFDSPMIKHNINGDFLDFWEAYPKKEAKKKALRAWQQCKNKPPIDVILQKLELHKKTDQWQSERGKFIPYPASYINQERWNDVLNINKTDQKTIEIPFMETDIKVRANFVNDNIHLAGEHILTAEYNQRELKKMVDGSIIDTNKPRAYYEAKDREWMNLHIDLLTDLDITTELVKRGFKGTLTYSKEINL